jgi:CRISPR-associated protein Csb1
MVNLSPLRSHDKVLFDVPVAPVQGHRFQPTGFPDLGAATFETDDGTCLLVESAQSMANRLEATCWDDATQALLPELTGLSYVRVCNKAKEFLTSSVLEAHRINSVYVEKADAGRFHDTLGKEIGTAKDRPIDRAALARALLKFDAGSLIHGVFLESIDGRLRVARALTSFVEADGVRVAASGGVKNDHVKPGTEKNLKAETEKNGEEAGVEKKKTAAEGFGNVPFHRDEFTARTITLFANIDLAQVRGYGLGDEPTQMLTLLALFKVRALLDGKLRLRTACDFKVVSDTVKATNADFILPSRRELLVDLQAAIKACGPHFAKDNGVTTVIYAG